MDKSPTFYCLAGLGLVTFVGSAFYLIKLFKESKEESQADRWIHSNIPHPISTSNSNKAKGEHNKVKTKEEIGLEVYASISREVDIQMNNYEEERRADRLKVITNPSVYVSLVSKYIFDKSHIYNNAKVKILAQYNMTADEFKELTYNLNIYDCEQALYHIYKPKFSGAFPPEKVIKKVYIEHCQEVLNVLTDLHNSSGDEGQKKAKMLMERVRIDDLMWERTGLTFSQLKYLLHHYKLFEDEEVNHWYNTVPS